MLLMAICLLPSSAQEKLKVGGTQREYKIYVPKNLGAKRPLLISCHGMNQDTASQMKSVPVMFAMSKMIVGSPLFDRA